MVFLSYFVSLCLAFSNWPCFVSPAVVGNLWDVTDKDIDAFGSSILSLLSGNNEGEGANPQGSLLATLSTSRDTCKLRFLNGAAPVCYGIPIELRIGAM